MGIQHNKAKDLHWNYYLTLVKDLRTISDYVEFDQTNYDTYSVELSKLLMAASSEVDVVLKQLCNTLYKRKKHKNIEDYHKTITSYLAGDFANETVHIPLHGLVLNPWSNWNGTTNPLWWKAYNAVKHERNNHFAQATLKNVLNAMAALFVCIVYLRAIEKEEWANGDKETAVCKGWGELKPREHFLKLDRMPYPLISIE